MYDCKSSCLNTVERCEKTFRLGGSTHLLPQCEWVPDMLVDKVPVRYSDDACVFAGLPRNTVSFSII